VRRAALGPLPQLPRDLGAREFAFGVDDFAALARFVEERTGIHLGAHKDELVYARLAKRLRALGLASFRDYRELIEGPDGGPEILRMVNALTTNLTRFFREPHHFDHLTATLAETAAGEPRRVRVWSAGCSTGQEAYSLALALADLALRPGWDVRVLATDIDTDVLAVARGARYAAAEAADIPLVHRPRLVETGAGAVEIGRRTRDLVTFKALNLIGPWPFKGPFDAIFCRNVAIYFAPPTRAALFARFRDMLQSGGHLYLGHSESLGAAEARFECVAPTVYRAM
jgi:chemotaxis protein methyltransferase CheR